MDIKKSHAEHLIRVMRQELSNLGYTEAEVEAVKFLLAEGEGLDASAIRKPASKIARMAWADVYVMSTSRFEGMSTQDFKNYDLAHIETPVREAVTEVIPDTFWNVDIEERMQILVVPSELNKAVEGLTIEEIQKKFNCKVIPIGSFRQERGKEAKLRKDAFEAVITYQENKIGA